MLCPAGRGPARAEAPRVWEPRPSRCEAGAVQRRGGLDSIPCWEKLSLGRGPTCVGATAITLLGWCRATVGGGIGPPPAGRSPAWAGAPHEGATRPSRCLACATQQRRRHDAASSRAKPGLGWGPTCVGATATAQLGWYRAAPQQHRGGHDAAPCRAKPGLGRDTTCVGAMAIALLCSSGEGMTPLPAGRSPAWAGDTCVWAPLPSSSRCLAIAWQRRGGHDSAPRRAKPCLGRGPTCVGRHGLCAAWLVPCSGGEGMMPPPAERSPAQAWVPRVCAPLPSRCSAGARQRLRGHDAALRRAKPGWGKGLTCVGSMAIALLGWIRTVEERA